MTVMNERIERIDSLLADYKRPEDLIGDNGLFKRLLPWRCCSRARTTWSAFPLR